MTIQRGQPWGTPIQRPTHLPRAESDAELASWVAHDPGGRYGVAAGDLHRSLGAPPDRAEMQLLPLDAFEVSFDGRSTIGVAHLVARRGSRLGWLQGPLLVVMNADHLGTWSVAPRAHPNDGRLDVVEVASSMSVRDRLQARSRLSHGTHLPHPDITVRTVTDAAWEFARPMQLSVDGRHVGRIRRLAVRILPDHFAVHA